MTRLWIAICGVVFFLAAAVRAQETAAPADTGSSSITPGPAAAGPAGAAPSAGNPPQESGAPSGATPSAPTQAPPTFSLPGGSGFVPRTISTDEGRFSQPPYRFTVTLTQGYDDNVFSAPSNPVKQQNQTVTVIVPEQKKSFTGNFVNNGGFFVPEFQFVTQGVAKKITLPPAPPPQEVVGSAVTTATIGFRTQALNLRTVYTLDASIGALYYWNRPGRATDYNSSFGLAFAHRINARLSVSAQGDARYSSQPDFSRINTPTNQTSSEYLSTNAKVDLSYLFSPRISTVASYTFSATLLQKQINGGDLLTNGLGVQGRYVMSPRTTLLVDLRESANTHPNDPNQDDVGTFLLIGADYAASQRLRATALFGEEIQTQTQDSSTLSTPYLETTTTYVFIRGSNLAWTNRFGFEESGNASQSRLSYRTNLTLNYVVGPRLTASLGVTYNRTSTSLIGSNAAQAMVENQLQASLALQYVLSRTLSFSASYSLTDLISDQPGVDYIRNQFFIGCAYSF